jgi:parvulin-like peptidyl-prolyl isomerase
MIDTCWGSCLGGYLGPMTRDKLVPEFAEVAFEIEPSDCGNPIWAEAKSPFGYHIIMVRIVLPSPLI